MSDLESEIKKSPACLAVSSVLGRLRLAAIFSLVLNCLFGGLALGGIALLVAVAGYYANYWWLIFSVGLILGVLITLILNLKFWSFPDIASVITSYSIHYTKLYDLQTECSVNIPPGTSNIRK